MKVSEGLHRIDNVRGANAYLVEADDGLLAVDAGLSGNAETIVEFVRSLGYTPTDVRTIVVTHADPDHAGGVARLKQLTGAKVAIHAADAPVLAGVARGKRPRGLLGAVFAVLGPMLRIGPVEAEILLGEGDSVAGFTVLHTPGHTPGSITLSRDGVVFPGDALLSDSKGNERPPSKALSADYVRALESAERIRTQGYRVLLPGHGAPVFAGVE